MHIHIQIHVSTTMCVHMVAHKTHKVSTNSTQTALYLMAVGKYLLPQLKTSVLKVHIIAEEVSCPRKLRKYTYNTTYLMTPERCVWGGGGGYLYKRKSWWS